MRKSAFVPCIPSRGRDGKRVGLWTRNGHDWSGRFRQIAEAALRNRNSSFVLDGEAVLLGVNGR